MDEMVDRDALAPRGKAVDEARDRIARFQGAVTPQERDARRDELLRERSDIEDVIARELHTRSHVGVAGCELGHHAAVADHPEVITGASGIGSWQRRENLVGRHHSAALRLASLRRSASSRSSSTSS